MKAWKIENITGLSINEIFTKEIFAKMRNYESFTLNVDTREIEEINSMIILDNVNRIVYKTCHDVDNHLYYSVFKVN